MTAEDIADYIANEFGNEFVVRYDNTDTGTIHVTSQDGDTFEVKVTREG